MPKAAIHPNGSNFRRAAKLDVVARVRMLTQMGLLKERPRWLEWCQRVPPMENHNLHLQARTIRNPYPQMVDFLLKKYPDLRFQDCYVDGNDWSAGNDSYRDDHPVMQFVAQQLKLMREEGLTKREAFKRTEDIFRERRETLEREQKVMMAMMAVEKGFKPMFSTGRAYLEVEMARTESKHLEKIIGELRKQRHLASAKLGVDPKEFEAARKAPLQKVEEKAQEKAQRKAQEEAEDDPSVHLEAMMQSEPFKETEELPERADPTQSEEQAPPHPAEEPEDIKDASLQARMESERSRLQTQKDGSRRFENARQCRQEEEEAGRERSHG
ncbi:N6AMT2 [Symbiodinium natans]|uniref:Small ribosomal subunit protein mS23 n=1 Tax=Symbiodinium natans TaxID=878477 RepID=A0A812S2A2_9DINO|nr:N6AMT2 [Symbiodinium natans]